MKNLFSVHSRPSCCRFSALFLLLAMALTVTGCNLGGSTVVTVDVEKILTDSKAAKEANDHLAKVQEILQRGLDAYQEELRKSPEENRQKELNQGLALLRRQLAIEQAAARKVVQDHMQAQVVAWQKDNPKATVIARQNLLAAPAESDITSVIITRMDAGSVKFADLPVVSIRTNPDAAAAQDKAAEEKADEKAADKKAEPKKSK